MDQESRRVSLKWKIGGTFAGVMLVLGLFVTVAVYQLTKNALRDQLDQRVLLLANALSDAAAGHIVGGNLLALHALARKYTLVDGVAFAFIENSKGEVIVHTLGAFPPELQQGLPITEQRQTYRRELSLSGRAVYATGVPILEGQLGTVHVGFWVDAVEKEIQRTLLPLVGIMAIVPLIGALDCSTHCWLNRNRGQGHHG
jgi:sensor histidine kinase regulating citrate/malate metabolism